MYRKDSHFDNSIGEVQIDTVTRLGKYAGERTRPILVTFAIPWDRYFILKNKANLERVYMWKKTFHLKYKKEETY